MGKSPDFRILVILTKALGRLHHEVGGEQAERGDRQHETDAEHETGLDRDREIRDQKSTSRDQRSKNRKNDHEWVIVLL